MKKCTRCSKELPETHYHKDKQKKDGLRPDCKKCSLIRHKEYRKKNAAKIAKRRATPEFKEKDKAGKKKRQLKYMNSKKGKEVVNKWKNKNREKLNKLERIRNREPNRRVMKAVRSRVKKMMYQEGRYSKRNDYIKYTPQELRQRLECQFTSEMDWSNYGVVWNIDHKKPLSLFDFSKKDNWQLCSLLCNLQPMLCKDNFSKGNRRIG